MTSFTEPWQWKTRSDNFPFKLSIDAMRTVPLPAPVPIPVCVTITFRFPCLDNNENQFERKKWTDFRTNHTFHVASAQQHFGWFPKESGIWGLLKFIFNNVVLSHTFCELKDSTSRSKIYLAGLLPWRWSASWKRMKRHDFGDIFEDLTTRQSMSSYWLWRIFTNTQQILQRFDCGPSLSSFW